MPVAGWFVRVGRNAANAPLALLLVFRAAGVPVSLFSFSPRKRGDGARPISAKAEIDIFDAQVG